MNSAKRSVLLVLHEAEQGAIESGKREFSLARLALQLLTSLARISAADSHDESLAQSCFTLTATRCSGHVVTLLTLERSHI